MLPLAGFESRTSGIGSDFSSTAHKLNFLLNEKKSFLLASNNKEIEIWNEALFVGALLLLLHLKRFHFSQKF